MKKILTAAIAATFIVLGSTALFAAKPKKAAATNGKLKIVTTIFPEYDWTREILGDRLANAELTLLLDNGVDLHSYQPTAKDIMRIAAADLFVYVGGESDRWVEDALKEAVNERMQVLNLLDVLGDRVKEEEIVEGMQAAEDGEDEEEAEYDEHVWLSLQNAALFATRIADALCTLDAANAAAYRRNLAAYTERLSALDGDYRAAVSSSRRQVLLFGDRFPFRYLADDYGLGYYAAFAGCSAETEASFKTVIFLANKVDELALPAVLTLEKSDGKIARTIIQSTKTRSARTLSLDSMQSTTAKDSKKGATYLGIMQANLRVLETALN